QGTVVDDEIDDILTNTEVVHQRSCFRWRPKSRDTASLIFEAHKKIAEPTSEQGNPLRQIGIGLKTVQSGCPLGRQSVSHRFAGFVRPLLSPCDAAQATAVRWHANGLDQFQIMLPKEPNQRPDSVIVEMLMVDSVEQHLLDDVEQIRDLEHKHPIGCEQYPHTL